MPPATPTAPANTLAPSPQPGAVGLLPSENPDRPRSVFSARPKIRPLPANDSETNPSSRGYPLMSGPKSTIDEPHGERMDDRALVEALRAGDPDAPARFVEQFQHVVFSLCLRMLHHRQDAEDVAQETFLRALRSIHRVDLERPVRPWLLGIAANRCRTALGRRRQPQENPLAIETHADPRPPLSDPDDLASELARALDSLRPEYRAVFVLFHQQGLPYEDISAALNRPIGTIKTWLHRARAQMADHLSRRGVSC